VVEETAVLQVPSLQIRKATDIHCGMRGLSRSSFSRDKREPAPVPPLRFRAVSETYYPATDYRNVVAV